MAMLLSACSFVHLCGVQYEVYSRSAVALVRAGPLRELRRRSWSQGEADSKISVSAQMYLGRQMAVCGDIIQTEAGAVINLSSVPSRHCREFCRNCRGWL